MESSTPMLQPLLPIFKEEEEPGESRKCTTNVFFHSENNGPGNLFSPQGWVACPQWWATCGSTVGNLDGRSCGRWEDLLDKVFPNFLQP